MLPQGVARSSCAPSSNTCFLSTFPADKMITTDTDTQRKQWKSSCQTLTNLLKTCCLPCLVIKLTECLLEDAKNKGSIGQYEGLREPTRKSQRDNNCDPSREGCQHAEPMTNDETSLLSPRWITVSQTRRCLQLPRFSNHSIFLQLRIKIEEGKVRIQKCSHEMVLLIFRAKHMETRRNTAHNSHHCLQLRENTTNHSKNDKLISKLRENTTNHSKHDKLMSKIRKHHTKRWQNRKIDAQN